MILFTILLITLVILLIATVIGIGCIGSVGIIIFGDVIIFDRMDFKTFIKKEM